MFYLFKVLVLFFLTSPLFATEFPKVYAHLPIPKQIERYRKIYANLSPSDYAKAQYIHLPDLLPILEDGMSLAYTFIMEDEKYRTVSGGDERLELKLMYIRELEAIWESTQGLLKNGEFSNKVLTTSLAAVADTLSLYKEELRYQFPAVQEINNEPYNADDELGLVFTLFAHPNPSLSKRGILTDHFVDQYCHDLSAGLALIDVHSNGLAYEERSKKFAHFGTYEGTCLRYIHDLAHSILRVRQTYPSRLTILRIIHRYMLELKQRSQWNEATILKNGLFLITHEQDNSTRANEDDVFDLRESIRKYLTLDVSKSLKDEDEEVYKLYNRDWEFVLKARYGEDLRQVHDKEGKVFFPLIQLKVGTQILKRPFPLVQNKQGKWIVVESQVEADKPEYIFVSKEEQKNADHKIILKRRKKLRMVLNNAYVSYWDCFLRLASEAFKQKDSDLTKEYY